MPHCPNRSNQLRPQCPCGGPVSVIGVSSVLLRWPPREARLSYSNAIYGPSGSRSSHSGRMRPFPPLVEGGR
jgi:hypothetical protein